MSVGSREREGLGDVGAGKEAEVNLDELDLSNVPDAVVRDARSGWDDDARAWVVTMDGQSGLLVATDGGAVWRFARSTWTMPWAALDDAVPLGERDLMVLRSGGEAYRFGFAGQDERAAFLVVRRERSVAPRGLPLPERGGAQSTLTFLFVAGIFLALVAAFALSSADSLGIALVLVVPAQVCLCVAVIGWGVMLGTRAAHEH